MIKIKNIYEMAEDDDGQRIYVELFWPEGLNTREARIDEWLPEISPSYELQRFRSDSSEWQKYKSHYRDELMNDVDRRKKLEELARKSENETITFLYGNKNPDKNHAIILKELIEDFLINNNNH